MMKKTSVKGIAKRLLCGLLVGAMVATVIPAAAQGTVVYAAEEENEQSIFKDFDGTPLEMIDPDLSMDTEMDEFVDPVSVGIALAIAGIEKIISSTKWGQAIKEFFGGDKNAQDVLDKINVIAGKLQDINNKLDKIIEMVVKKAKKDEIAKKLIVTRQAETHTSEFIASFEAAGTIESKREELDKWFNNSIGDQKDMINFIDLYSKTITNSDGNNTFGDFFKLYDELAQMTFIWQSDRDAFITINQQKDIQLILKMAAMAGLWLSKEKEKAVNDPSMLKVLEAKTQVVKEALQNVEKLAKDHQVMNCLQKDFNILYYDNKEIKIATHPAVIETSVYDDYAFKSTMVEGREYRETLDKSTQYIKDVLGGNAEKGFTLMNTPQFDFFADFAKKQGTTIAKLFNDKGIVMGGITNDRNEGRVLLSLNDYTNQPLRILGGRAGGWRYMHIVSGNVTTNSQYGYSFQDASMKICDHGVYTHYSKHNRYEVTDRNEDRDTLDRNVKPTYGLLWIQVLKGNFGVDEESEETNVQAEVYETTGTITKIDGQQIEVTEEDVKDETMQAQDNWIVEIQV